MARFKNFPAAQIADGPEDLACHIRYAGLTMADIEAGAQRKLVCEVQLRRSDGKDIEPIIVDVAALESTKAPKAFKQHLADILAQAYAQDNITEA